MTTAAELARAYDAYVSALWRGDTDVSAIGSWLAAFWHADAAPAPTSPPSAISPCGAGGRGIRWHDTPTTVLGCVPGAVGCYSIPADAALPVLGPLPIDMVLEVRLGMQGQAEDLANSTAESCDVSVAARSLHDAATTGSFS